MSWERRCLHLHQPGQNVRSMSQQQEISKCKSLINDRSTQQLSNSPAYNPEILVHYIQDVYSLASASGR